MLSLCYAAYFLCPPSNDPQMHSNIHPRIYFVPSKICQEWFCFHLGEDEKNNFGIFMIYAMSCWWEAERRWLERTKTTSHLKSGPESPRILSFSLSALLWSQVLLINSEETLSEQIIFCAFLFFLLICVFKAFFDSRFLSPDSNIAGPYKFLICFVSVVVARSALTTSL